MTDSELLPNGWDKESLDAVATLPTGLLIDEIVNRRNGYFVVLHIDSGGMFMRSQQLMPMKTLCKFAKSF